MIDLDLGYQGHSGLVLECESGVRWHNQCGGLQCLQHSLEGVLLPIPDLDSVGGTGRFGYKSCEILCCGVTGSDLTPERLGDLRKLVEDHFGGWLALDESKEGLRETTEAWVRVRVLEEPEEYMHSLKIVGKRGVLVYGNCD